MKQFDKDIRVAVNPTDPISLRAALNRYQNLLQSEDAFQKGITRQFNIEFKHSDGRRLQVSDAGAQKELLSHAFRLIRHESLPDRIEADSEIYISEPLLFAAALNLTEQDPALNKELKEELIATAEAIVAYARKRNDSSDFWVDDMYAFGLEALYMLALEYPETLPLYTSFVIPYWDYEHLNSLDGTVLPFLENEGWSDNLLRAYLWCDNPMFRSRFNFNGQDEEDYESLAEHLRNNPERYNRFKALLRERLLERPLLAYHDDSSLEELHPVLTFYQSLDFDWPVDEDRYDEDEWYDAVNQLPFGGDAGNTLEEEALALYRAVKTEATQPLVVVANAHLQNDEDEDGDALHERQLLNLLEFIGSRPQGQQLRAYIEHNLQNPDPAQLLNRLAALPCDNEGYIGEIYHEGFLLNFSDWMELPFEIREVQEGFHLFLKEIRHEFLNPGAELPALERLSADERQEGFLRLAEVFWRLIGKPELSLEQRRDLSNNFGFISEEAFAERFEQQPADDSQHIAEFTQEVRYLTADVIRLQRLQQLDEAARQRLSVLQPDLWPVNAATLTYAAWCTTNVNLPDGICEKMGQWLNRELMPFLCKALAEECESDEGNKEPYRRKRARQQQEQQQEQLPEPLLRYLTVNDGESFEQSLSSGRHLAMTEQLKKILLIGGGREGCRFSDQQPSYHLFWHHNGFQYGILALFYSQIGGWMLNLPAETALLSQRLWRLLLAVAPQAVIKQVIKTYSDYPLYHAINDESLEHEVYQQLEKTGANSADLEVFQLLSDASVGGYRPAHSRFWQHYVGMLDHFADIDPDSNSMMEAAARKQYAAFITALQKRSEAERIQFYLDLKSRHQETGLEHALNLPWDDIKRSFEQSLTSYLMLHSKVDSSLDWEEETAAKRQQGQELAALVLAYLNAEEKPDRKALQKTLKSKLEQRLSSSSAGDNVAGPQPYIWALLADEQSNRLLELMLSHSARGLKMIEQLESAYVADQISSGKLPMSERQSHDIIGNGRHADYDASLQLRQQVTLWALERLENLDVPKASLIAFAYDNGALDYISAQASQGPLPKLDKVVGSKDRQQLAQWLASTDAVKHAPGLQSMQKDSSKGVSLIVISALEKIKNLLQSGKGE